jgi:hypothetical protein
MAPGVEHPAAASTQRLDDVIERIRTRGDVSAMPARYARAARVVQHVLAYASIPQGLQDEVKNELGMPGLIELVTWPGSNAAVLMAAGSFPAGEPGPRRGLSRG